MASKKIQLYTDRANTIEASPETSANCVILSDGNDLQKVLDNDLTNPTVVHEETSFKVGAGDIDVSSSVVDGEVGRMVIKGKTYQNILPEPSTHVLTNNKEMFKVNEGLDPNVEIVDGVSKSAILSGSTERRVSKNLFNGRIKNNADINSATGQESATGSRTISLDYTPVLPSTEYTFTRPINTKQMGYRLYRSDKSFIKFQALGNNLSATFTTTSDTAYFKFIDEANTLTEGYQLELGSVATEYEPYFEPHLISCKMPVLTTIGKNLLNEATMQGGYISSTGSIVSDYANARYDYVRINPNTKYYGYNFGYIKAVQVSWYDLNKTFLYRDNCPNGNYLMSPSNAYYGIVHGQYFQKSSSDNDYSIVKIMFSTESITDYAPYKSNILHTPEEVVLRSVENAQDTINLNTGEYVQRIGEVILNGSESWQVLDNNTENTIGFTLRKVLPLRKTGDKYVKVNCDKLPSYKENLWNNDKIGCVAENNINQDLNDTQLQVRVLKSTLSTQDTNGFKSWLQTNPLTIQYILETPVVKTVDLSSSENWMELTLTGEEEWRDSGNTPYITPSVQPKKGLIPFSNGEFVGVDIAESFACFWLGGGTNTPNGNLVFYHPMVKNAIQMKEFLRNNPQKIYYYVEDGMGCIKQPIFFKDGHIQLSSGADHSLIPTLDYQAKTSNSYVIDLMKTNTKYTMKAKSASGTFTIDGTSYGAGTNGTFTTPSSMTNKLLVMGNKTNTEVMILEGDVTDKTIPYFKGIKSAFEDEDKIEVLSTGRNLCPPQPEIEGHYVRYQNGTYVQHDSYNVSKPIRVIEGHRYRLINTNKHHAYYDKNMNYVTTPLFSGSDGDFYSIAPKNAVYLRVSMMKGLEAVVNTDGVKGEYREPNSTKIPLLSPLRSLPNGVCDELIVDRMKKKATLIQRVGYVTLGQGDGWGSYDNVGDTMKVGRSVLPHVKSNGGGMSALIPYTFNSVSQPNEGVYIYRHASSSEARVRLKLKRTGRHDAVGMQNWLRNNNIVTLYELETPIVTEIDLESFPLVYKDGHIFLNSEIAPVVEIDYNVNQAQQIQSNNETLQRHELDILDLDNLIVSFVNAEYNLRLLKFDMELSMMALAE